MKKTELDDLKTKTIDELKRMLLDSREALIKATHEASVSEVKNTNTVKNIKKNIARILTFLSMKIADAESISENKEVVQNG